jgi:hypothetical protein
MPLIQFGQIHPSLSVKQNGFPAIWEADRCMDHPYMLQPDQQVLQVTSDGAGVGFTLVSMIGL